MKGKRKRNQRNYLFAVFALEMMKTEQTKGRDKAMLQKKIEYWQEVKSE